MSSFLHPRLLICRRADSVRVAIGAAVAAMAVSGHAATQNVYTWDGGAGTSNWFDAANWSGDVIPGSTQNIPGNVIDQAQIGNVSGTINYTPGTPTTFDYLNLTGTTAALTFNINGNLTTTHVNSGTGGVTTPVWYANPDALGGAVVTSPGLVVNVNSGATYTVQQQGITLMAREFNIASGGTVQSAWNRSDVRALLINSGTTNVQGTFTAMPGWQVPGTFGTGTTFATRGSGGIVIARGGSPTVNVDGGSVSVGNIAWASGGASLSGTSTVNVTNNGTVAIQFGGSLDMSGNTAGSGQTWNSALSMSSGTITNNGLFRTGQAIDRPQDPGFARVTLSGGDLIQNGATYFGDYRVGIVSISGSARFTTPSDVFVGGGNQRGSSAPTGSATASGTLSISSGTVTISNPNAGVVRSLTSSRRPDSVLYFGNEAGSTWSGEYEGQRVIFTGLAGSGTSLSTGTVYYTRDWRLGDTNPFSTFAVAAGSNGVPITGATSYTSGTFYTLGARLLVGNMTTFSGTSYVVPGTLNLSGGRLVVDEFVANQGANSTINFTGGSFRINNSSDVNTGSQLQVGDGTLAAVLDIAGGTNAFAQGLRINNNATLMGTGTITAGTVTIASGGIHSPGNSPGIQTVAAETWQSGGIYRWEINALSGVAGTNWDQINVTGLLDLSGLSEENPFILDLTTLTLANTPGALATPFDNGTYVFQIASYGSLASPSPLGTAPLTDLSDLFDIRFTNWVSPQPTGGSVRINSSGTGLELVIVPEPGALALAGIGIAVAAWAARRRRIMPR